jgi:hypothetical protein
MSTRNMRAVHIYALTKLYVDMTVILAVKFDFHNIVHPPNGLPTEILNYRGQKYQHTRKSSIGVAQHRHLGI